MRASNWRLFSFSILILSFWAFNNSTLQAQVEAPDFQCVLKDTLFWDIPINSCGSFNGYLIYVSPSAGGPFSLLTTITDPNQIQFYHDNPNDLLRYYYMESDYNCPGEPVLQSQILDNQIPEVNPIEWLTVQGNDVLITWPANPSPEVIGYIVYRTTALSGTIPIDTVIGATNYLDVGASPDQRSEIYYIIAIDECGNSSIFGDFHETIFLKTAYDICEQKALLSWNNYVGWGALVDRQELWLSIDNNPPELIETFGPETIEYVYENVQDQSQYCFQIRAYQQGSALETFSNEVCELSEVVQPANALILENARVNDLNEVELIWQWNTNAELSNVSILRADAENDLAPISDVPISDPLLSVNQFSDPSALVLEQPYRYQIATIDDCDSLLESNAVSTIHLSGFALRNLTNQLQWTPFEHGAGQVVSYDLYRIVNGLSSLATSFSPTEQFYIDPVDGTEAAEAEVCYYIEAEAEINLPNGDLKTIRSQSNTLCIKQFSTVLIPNAFVPEGRNYEFKPRILFSGNVNYYMAIFDRGGQVIFETRDVDTGWTGKKGDRLLPWGAYTYLIQIEQANGQNDEYTGQLILLR